ncbi:MAG: hypothetical protein HQL95_01505 [Magnetococcales bacterium]|nr:hypothetical protein [Magnetococcales bacterium]
MNPEVDNINNGLNVLQNLQQGMASGGEPGASLLMGSSISGIVASLIFGMIGLLLFRSGKRNGPLSSMIYGALLMVFPYFVTETVEIITIGAVLSLLSFLVKFG